MCVLGLKLETDIKSGGKATWARVRGEVQFYSKASPYLFNSSFMS